MASAKSSSPLHIARDLSLPLDAVTQTFGILGKRGGGKSYVAKVMAEEMLSAGAHVCAVDPIGNWFGLRVSGDGKSPGVPITVLGGDCGDVPLEATEKAGEFVARLIVEEKLSLVIDLSRFRKHEQTAFMIGWAETLYRLNRDALHLFIDEADAWAPQRPVGNLAPRLLGAMEDLVRRGRARGLGMTMITQRSASINKDLLTQIEVLIAKRTIAPQDREAIEAWVEVHGTPEQQKVMMNSLPSLPIADAWFWSPAWLNLFLCVTVRRLHTLDSSATPSVGQKRIEPRKLADVDLARLRDRMAETIQRAKADDPRELRREIADLKKQLAKPAAPAKAERIEVPVLKDSQIARLEAIAAKLSEAAAAITQAIRKAPAPPAPRPTAPRPTAAAPPAPVRRAAAAPSGNSDLPSGERAILTVIAQHPGGVTREQLTVIAGYKRSSRDAYVQRLGSKGFIEFRGSDIFASAEGLSALGDFEPLPTGDALRAHWLEKLPEGESKLLDLICAFYPGSVDRESLSDQSGYKRSSRDAYLQRLAARKLIVPEGRGMVRASAELFG